MPKVPKTSLQYLCNVSRKLLRINLVFCLQINIKVFFKLLYHFRFMWPDMPKLPKITSLLFFAISKNLVMLIFLYADKHEGLLQIDSMILMGMVKHCQSSKFAMSLQCLKKKLKMKLIFCM